PRYRVREAGAHQGPAGAPGDLEARVQECRAARRHVRRARVRRAAERIDHHRDGLQLAGCRPARHRGGRLPRLSDRADRRALSLRDVHRREPPGGRALRVSQSEDQVRGGSAPPSAAAPRTEAARRRRDRRWPPAIPLAIVLTLVVCAVFAPLLAPRSPVEGSLGERLIPPLGMEGARPGHPLGTDRLGRDALSRLVYGARISLSVSIVGIVLTGTLGSFIGLLAGFLGGWVDTLLMRVVDISLSLPGILIAVLLSVVFEPSFTNVIIVVVFLLWPSYARLVRGETLGLKQQEFVALARIAGCSTLTIMLRHIVPNVIPSILVLATLHVGYVIVLEAALSFLGVGIPPPTPSWGVMVADGRGLIEQAWWVSILPGIAILVTVLSLNILGDSIRDRLDPKLRQV